MPAGRPKKFKEVEEMQAKIDDYFKNCPDFVIISAYDKNTGEFVTYNKITPTITGLALHLGFVSRQSMLDYEKREEFSCTIKKARTRIEKEYEKQLHNDKCAGAIFALKNFGWKDKVELEHNVEKSTKDAFLQHLKDMAKNAD